MKNANRREFLQASAMLVATAFAGSSFDVKKNKPLLSFSTLGCPDWTFKQIIDFAAQHNYNGIEIRGILKQMDLPLCNEFNSAAHRSATLKMMEDKNLRFVDLGSSCTLHFPDGTERKKNIDEGKRFIDLAHDIKCPFVRVFPNNFQKDQERNATMGLIAKGLLEIGDYAKGSNVSVLMETHGDFVKTEDLETIMLAANHPNTGLVWDVANMWAITKEPPVQVFEKLKKYIRHTHIKDAKLADGKINYVFLGHGDVPIFEGIDALAKNGYKGYYSFEWEKLWHPEIAEPELAIADYSKVMVEHFK
jgi:sugar phosphate isomerase/epimerase